MKQVRALALAAAVASLSLSGTASAERHTPKITMEQARTLALARVHGIVMSQEYEREGGRWIYSFDVRPDGETGKKILEVHVDGDTGTILAVEVEKS